MLEDPRRELPGKPLEQLVALLVVEGHVREPARRHRQEELADRTPGDADRNVEERDAARVATVFLHLLDASGTFVAGSDRFDVDAFALQPGDRYLQRHTFDAPPGTYTLEIGLYDPQTGERTLTVDGRDSVSLGAVTLP